MVKIFTDELSDSFVSAKYRATSVLRSKSLEIGSMVAISSVKTCSSKFGKLKLKEELMVHQSCQNRSQQNRIQCEINVNVGLKYLQCRHRQFLIHHPTVKTCSALACTHRHSKTDYFRRYHFRQSLQLIPI